MLTCAFRNGFALLLVALALGCGSGGARAKATDSDPPGSDDPSASAPSASNVLRSPKLLVADVAGAYTFEVVVSDNTGQSEPVVFTVTAS